MPGSSAVLQVATRLERSHSLGMSIFEALSLLVETVI